VDGRGGCDCLAYDFFKWRLIRDGGNYYYSRSPTGDRWPIIVVYSMGRPCSTTDRWVNYLNPAINHLPFSREDDLLLWQGHKEHGKRWVEISVKIFHSTRSENHIKNRWYSAAFKKFIAKEIGIDAYVDSKQYEGGGRKGDDGSNMS
jgi:hypothetical protein